MYKAVRKVYPSKKVSSSIEGGGGMGKSGVRIGM